MDNETTTDANVLRLMQARGGSFAKALATAWLLADQHNKAELMRTFHSLYDGYAEQAAHRPEFSSDDGSAIA